MHRQRRQAGYRRALPENDAPTRCLHHVHDDAGMSIGCECAIAGRVTASEAFSTNGKKCLEGNRSLI